MVNPLGHWLRVTFCTRSWIPLRGLSGFQVPPGLVVPAEDVADFLGISPNQFSVSLNIPYKVGMGNSCVSTDIHISTPFYYVLRRHP